MKQILKKLNRAKTNYILFNESVILTLLFLVAVTVASFILESDILKLSLEFTPTSLLMWLFIGGPSIALGLAFILSFINYYFLVRVYRGVKGKKYYFVKTYVNYFSVMIVIIAILLLAAIGLILGGLFIEESGNPRNWDKLGFTSGTEADLYLQFYVFGSWVGAFLVLLFGIVALSLIISTKKSVVKIADESTYDTKIVPLAEKEIINIKKTIASVEKEMGVVEKESKRLSKLTARLQNSKILISNKIVRDVEKTKLILSRDFTEVRARIAQLEDAMDNVPDPIVGGAVKDLKQKADAKESDIKKLTTPKKEEPKVSPKKEEPKVTPKKEEPKVTPKKEEPKVTPKKVDPKPIVVAKTEKKEATPKKVESKPLVKKTKPKEKEAKLTKPKKVVVKKNLDRKNPIVPKEIPNENGPKIWSQKELVKRMHRKINNKLTLGDVYKFNEAIIRKFVNEFGKIIVEYLTAKNELVFYKFLSMKHFISKPSARANPQNPQEKITIPSKNRVRVTFSQSFREEIAPEIERPEIKWDKKMTLNLTYDEAWEKVTNNIDQLLLLPKTDLLKLANYANVDVKAESKKEDIVDEMKYIDVKYAQEVIKEDK